MACAVRLGAAPTTRGSIPTHQVQTLVDLVRGDHGGSQHCREAALLAIDQLCFRLRTRFEPYLLPQLEERVIALYADKDRGVSDAAARVVKTLVTGLNPLAVKLVLPALYRGMEVAAAWRTKEACIQALGLLAQHAPSSTGPCLQDARLVRRHPRGPARGPRPPLGLPGPPEGLGFALRTRERRLDCPVL